MQIWNVYLHQNLGGFFVLLLFLLFAYRQYNDKIHYPGSSVQCFRELLLVCERVEHLCIYSYPSLAITILCHNYEGKRQFSYSLSFLIHPAEQFTLLIIHYKEINHDFEIYRVGKMWCQVTCEQKVQGLSNETLYSKLTLKR